MKTIVQGKKITNKWSVDAGKEKRIVNGEEREIFVKKPSLTKEEGVEWLDICEYDAGPQCRGLFEPKIYLSETEEVVVDKEIFRADLGTWFQRVNKVLEEIDANKEESESELQTLMAEFNKTVIENDTEMSNYCKLHKLTPEETDAEDLYRLLHPDKHCKFDVVLQTYRNETISEVTQNIRKGLYYMTSEFETEVSVEDNANVYNK